MTTATKSKPQSAEQFADDETATAVAERPAPTRYKPAAPLAPVRSEAEKERLRQSVGSIDELRELQAAAEQEARACAEAVEAINRDRDSKHAEVDRVADESIQSVRAQAGTSSVDATKMLAARQQLIASAPVHLADQYQAARRAVKQSYSATIGELETAIRLRESLQTTPRATLLDQIRFYSPDHPLYVAGLRDMQGTAWQTPANAHLSAVIPKLVAELPALKARLAEQMALRQQALDVCEDEYLAALIDNV